jgi:carboxyl-terminal processing protease
MNKASQMATHAWVTPSKSKLRRTALAAGLISSLLSFGISAEDNKTETSTAPSLPPISKAKGLLPLEDLRTFTKVYDHIRRGYVEEVDDSKLLEYAIKGILSELDPHSSYLDASSFDDLQMNTTGEFGGLGMEVGMDDGYVKVISPIDDTPAEKAGIEAGDLIIELDGKTVKGMNLNDAINVMRGPIGSDIDITVVREGKQKPMEFTLTRDTVKVKSVRSRVIDDEIAYVRIAQFQLATGEDMIDSLTGLLEDNPDLKGVVLDLRNNPGGVLQASVKVVDAFLNQGLIVYTEGRAPNSEVKFSASEGDITQGLPMVVLINDGSASASEIVAGALQDHKRAVIMGTDSFGKGSVQTVIPISEERAIKLTTALYYTPNGRSIQAKGIVPDILIERARVTAVKPRNRVTEADLNGHLGNASGSKESKSADRIAKQERSNEEIFNRDNQLFEALTLLKGLHIFAQRPQISLPQSTIAAAEQVETETTLDDGEPE